MAEETKEPITSPIRTFGLNEDKERSAVLAITVFRNEQRMVTASRDMTLRLWELKDGVVLKTMEGHREWVRAVAVSGDGKLIASGDDSGELMAWNGDSGESLTKAIRSHSSWVRSLDFSPNGAVLATGSSDSTTKLWSTTTWQLLGDPIECNDCVFCVQYSLSNEHLGIATSKNIQIWNPDMMQLVSKFTGDSVVPGCIIFSLAWPPDGKCLLSVGDSSIREWDTLTWQQVGKSWEGHTSRINTIAIHPAGTLVASASEDKHVHLWRLSDRRTVATFQHSHSVRCVTFSTNGKHLLSVGDNKISEWGIPEDYLPKDDPKEEMIDEMVIPGQDYHYMQDTAYNFFRGTDNHISRPQPWQRPTFLKRLRLAVITTPHSTAPATISSAAPITFKARLQQLSTRRHAHAYDHAAPPVVEVPFTKAKERHIAAGDPGPDKDWVPDEYFDQESESQQQSASVAGQTNSGEHGSGTSCFCF